MIYFALAHIARIKPCKNRGDMGILQNFLQKKSEEKNQLSDYLYERVDRLDPERRKKLTSYIFETWAADNAGLMLLRKVLIPGINKHINSAFFPNTRPEVLSWLHDVFLKTDPEIQKSILVTAIFDVYQHTVLSAGQIMAALDKAIFDFENEESQKHDARAKAG